MRAIRNGLQGAGIPVENSKGEWGPGQEEINVRYAEALEMADRHVILKNACKEIAWTQGRAITFMAKWNYGLAGNSAHIHQSLWSKDGAKPLFYDRQGDHGMSALMKNYVAGLLAHAGEITYFLAPYINSYKRFQAGTFAPTRAVWSFDNRTAGYRLCGAESKGVRIECRVGGADLNPYLAFAALIAAGLDGVEKKMELEPVFSGDAYDTKRAAREIPKTLRDALALLDKSSFLRGAMGDDVIDHYLHTGRWEQFEYDRRITDWEIKRGFERS
jgi:glutamine synthetase